MQFCAIPMQFPVKGGIHSLSIQLPPLWIILSSPESVQIIFSQINHRNDLMTVEISRQILFAIIGLPVEEMLKEDIDEHSCLYPLDTEGAEGCLQKIVECPRQVGANPCPLSRVYSSLYVYHSVN